MPAAQETMLAAIEERMRLAPWQRAKPGLQKENLPWSSSAETPPPTIDYPPSPRRALVVGAADAACWAMQRTLVDTLVRKGLITESALCDEVRAIYLAQREILGEEGAAHMRAWMRQLGCTDIPLSQPSAVELDRVVAAY
jgi:hypothetical protein